MSLTLGKFLITTGLSNNNVAANIGRDAFFEPEIETLPLILQGPLTVSYTHLTLPTNREV